MRLAIHTNLDKAHEIIFLFKAYFSILGLFLSHNEMNFELCFLCKALKEVLSSNSSKQHDPDFASMRESILQVKYLKQRRLLFSFHENQNFVYNFASKLVILNIKHMFDCMVLFLV